MEQQHREWLWESVRYFRVLGFFSQERSLSDADLMQQIIAAEETACQTSGGTPFWERPAETQNHLERDEPPTGEDWLEAVYARMYRPRPDYKDLLLLAKDKTRLWWEEGEGDNAPGDNVYVRLLEEWSAVSRGAFLPRNIREVWDNPAQWPECQVKIYFSLQELECILEPWAGYGWLDFGLLNGINSLIAESGYAYEIWDTNDQTDCVLVLTEKEKQRLVSERRWEFTEVAVLGYGFRDF